MNADTVDFDTDAVTLRPAAKSHCRTIAALYSISSDGVADYIWTKLAGPGEAILDVGERRYQREDSVFSYRNCSVATLDDAVVGMLVAFPMFVEPGPEAPQEDPVLAPYGRLEEHNSYYICGMAVFPEYRGRGVGGKFLALAEAQAKDQGFSKLSLIVFEENAGAKRLYERHGYREVARQRVVFHPLLHYAGDALLMVKELP